MSIRKEGGDPDVTGDFCSEGWVTNYGENADVQSARQKKTNGESCGKRTLWKGGLAGEEAPDARPDDVEKRGQGEEKTKVGRGGEEFSAVFSVGIENLEEGNPSASDLRKGVRASKYIRKGDGRSGKNIRNGRKSAASYFYSPEI